MRPTNTRTFIASLGLAGSALLLTGCDSTSSHRASASSTSQAVASANHTYIPIETIPDWEYTGPLRDSSESSVAANSSGVRFNGPDQSGASFQPISDSDQDFDSGSGRGSLLTPEKRTYYYYPSAEVYFDPDRNLYFWQVASNQWESGENLPRSINLSEREREMIQLRTPQPQRYHSKIKIGYPAGGLMSHIED